MMSLPTFSFAANWVATYTMPSARNGSQLTNSFSTWIGGGLFGVSALA